MKTVNDVLKEIDRIDDIRKQLVFCDDILGQGIHRDVLDDLLESYRDTLCALPIKR